MTLMRTVLAVVGVTVLALVGVGLAVASIDQRALTERVVSRVLRTSSETLGREIRADGARGRLLPTAQVTIEGLTVAGLPGDSPLVRADEVQVHLRTWPLLRSLGREVEIAEVAVRRPVVQLIRAPDGAWSFEGIGPRPGAETELIVRRVSVADGVVQVIDRAPSRRASGAPSDEASVALTRIDLAAEVADEGASTLTGRAALASASPNVSVELRIDPAGAPASAPEASSEGREGRWPALEGTIGLRDVQLARLGGLLPAGLTEVLRGGEAALDAAVTTRDDGTYQVAGDGELSNVRLRGQPLRGALSLTAILDPARPSAFHADVDRLQVAGPGLALAGRAAVQGEPRRVSFALAGPLLDLDVLLAALPERAPDASREGLLPPSLRRAVGEVAAVGTLRLDRVVRGGLELRDLVASARLRAGTVTLDRAEAGLFGGRVVADGSDADLRPAVPTWRLRTRLRGVDLSAMTRSLTGSAPLVGRLDAALDVEGAGAEWEVVRRNVHGSGEARIVEGALTSVDVGAEVVSHALAGLRRVGRAPDRLESLERSRTELRALGLEFRVGDGALSLRRPLTLEAGFGGARLDGRIGLDQSLDLTGTILLAPALVERIVRVRPTDSIEVPVRVRGSVSDPALELPPTGELAAMLLEPVARQGLRRVEREVEERVGREVEARIGRELGRELERRVGALGRREQP